jgi:hypothetical protein
VVRDDVETIRRLYAEVLGPGKLPDPATAELLPEFFDPDVEVREMTSLVGTAGSFHCYRGLMESNR